MITKFKLYEILNEIRLGYWVSVKLSPTYGETGIFRDSIDNNIHKIIDINFNLFNNRPYKIPIGYGFWLSRDEIVDFDKDKDELEMRISAKNFNL